MKRSPKKSRRPINARRRARGLARENARLASLCARLTEAGAAVVAALRTAEAERDAVATAAQEVLAAVEGRG